MIEIKLLDKSFQKDFSEINKKVREYLKNPEWFMPLSEENTNDTFKDGSTLVVYGAIIDGVLGGASILDLNTDEFIGVVDGLGVENLKGAELGGSMVLPEYRGKNLMYQMNLALVEKAKDLGIKYIVATAHPDNVASNNSLKKLGMECKKTIFREGKYLRNVYLMLV